MISGIVVECRDVTGMRGMAIYMYELVICMGMEE